MWKRTIKQVDELYLERRHERVERKATDAEVIVLFAEKLTGLCHMLPLD